MGWPGPMIEVEEFPTIYEIENFTEAFETYRKDIQSTVKLLLSGKWKDEDRNGPYDLMGDIDSRNFSKMALYYIAWNSISEDYSEWYKNREVLLDCLQKIRDSYYGEHHMSEMYYLIKIAYIVESVPEIGDHDIGLNKQVEILPSIMNILVEYFTTIEGRLEFPMVRHHVMKILSRCIFDEHAIKHHRFTLREISEEMEKEYKYHQYFKEIIDYFENVKPYP